jgi:hypothetical protein
VHLLLERGVLADRALDMIVRKVVFQIADLPEKMRDVLALTADLLVGGAQPVLGVQRAFAP